MAYPKAYLEGVKLFNEGSYWHAHEAWETLWIAQKGETRRFIQGLIQIAAALVHWQRGNRRGLLLNWGKARPKLTGFGSPYWGLDLNAIVTTMDALASAETDEPPKLILT